MEGRLTAWSSGDPVLTAELENELKGGHKVHALNAGLLFEERGVTAENASTTLVEFKGQMRPAYEAGKRLTHMWNYGASPEKVSETFWLPLPFAREVDAKLRGKYEGVAAWRVRLTNEVFGLTQYRCGKCGYVTFERGYCTVCALCAKKKIEVEFSHVVQQATKMGVTPFGRRRLYLGRRKDGANKVAAQIPQSCGASIWNRTLLRLHGWDAMRDCEWDLPSGPPLRFVPTNNMSDIARAEWGNVSLVSTGTYDSYLVECSVEVAAATLKWMLWTMEQPWDELDGLCLPAEGAVGFNWRKYDEERNPRGLREVQWGVE